MSPSLSRFGSAACPFIKTGQGSVFKSSGGATGCFFPAINGVAKHFRYGFRATGEVDLKSVCLFFGAPFGVDAPDVFF